MGCYRFRTVWDEVLERDDGMPFLSWNKRSWVWSWDTIPSVILLPETRSWRTHRRLPFCCSFGDMFFWGISLRYSIIQVISASKCSSSLRYYFGAFSSGKMASIVPCRRPSNDLHGTRCILLSPRYSGQGALFDRRAEGGRRITTHPH